MVDQSKSSSSELTDLSFTDGKVFEKVFVDGMALVEETASYLDGPGRKLSSSLPREASLTYAAWSMELTTRLMQAASWLVMQKAVRDGDMHPNDAMQSKYRISREDPALDATAQRGRGLPDVFLDLVDRSENLFERICRLDQALYGRGVLESGSPVGDQLAQLQKAAETGAFDPLRVWGKAR
jgi:regulator of CtrA degradation